MVEDEHDDLGEAFGVNLPIDSISVGVGVGVVMMDVVCTSMGLRPIFLTYVSRSTLS